MPSHTLVEHACGVLGQVSTIHVWSVLGIEANSAVFPQCVTCGRFALEAVQGDQKKLLANWLKQAFKFRKKWGERHNNCRTRLLHDRFVGKSGTAPFQRQVAKAVLRLSLQNLACE